MTSRRNPRFLAIALAMVACAPSPPTDRGLAAVPERGVAIAVPASELIAALHVSDTLFVRDTALRVVEVEDRYNIGIAAVRRLRGGDPSRPDALEHREISEVYHIIEGTGVLVTGGSLVGAVDIPDGPVVRRLIGPSARGVAIRNGVTHRVGPGDVIVIPPNTPHGFREITSERIVYLLVRVDPDRVLAADSTSAAHIDDPGP